MRRLTTRGAFDRLILGVNFLLTIAMSATAGASSAVQRKR